MNDIKFTKDETDRIVSHIKKYFNDELDQEIGGFEAEFLLDFFAREIGPVFYNRGLSDARDIFAAKAEETGYLVEELEKPVG
ncbi:DUF2164 domain-containing protein [Amphritea pacifica]|uniref:DUF2164 domain-containing protein n=1 Tax=Amphritea pacifica TaxID=2811233 RepID=UPI0019659871|nr:DUF2164 domain-containing protein [Amphritea pacifica]MBN1007277.1 DUF2164 domain-containing protein [Amphritea pacifica]